jgi:hypothetical protein
MLRQDDCEFKANLCYIVKCCLKKERGKKKNLNKILHARHLTAEFKSMTNWEKMFIAHITEKVS